MSKTPAIQVRTDWEGDLSELYEQAVAQWLDTDKHEAEAFYRERVFPLGCERIRQARAEASRLDLLFVPVGTQPYAPLLAILGNPADSVALLETKESYVYGQQVEAALEAEEHPPSVLHVRIEQTDVLDIASKMKAVYDSRGLPAGSRVGADVTGGKKSMTSAISGVGSLLGWRLFYVDGIFARQHSGFAHHETVIELANVLAAFGRTRREVVKELLARGAIVAAERELADICQESLASASDRKLLAWVRAGLCLRRGQLRSFVKLAPAVLQDFGLNAPDSLERLLQDVSADRPHARSALLLLSSSVCQSEGNPLAARMLVHRAIQKAFPAFQQAEHLSASLACFPGQETMKTYLEPLSLLDAYFGHGLGELVRGQI